MTTTNTPVQFPLTIVIESDGDGEINASVEAPGFFHATVGATVDEVTANLRDLIADYLEHEGKTAPQWQGITLSDVSFTYEYDLTALFEVFKAIKIGAVADEAGINPSLMRQYASGVKHASTQQAKKIETAIRRLGERLMHVAIA